MKGGHVVELLSGFKQGTLSADQRERVKTHLIFCLTCRNSLEGIKPNGISNNTPSTEAPRAPTVATEVAAWIKQLPFPVYGAILAVFLICVGGVGRFIHRYTSQKSISEPLPIETVTAVSIPEIPKSTPVSTPTPTPIEKPAAVVEKKVPVVPPPPAATPPPMSSNGLFTELRGGNKPDS